MSRNTNILVCGIGGQGVMTATEILAEAALALGFDAKKTEVAGMSQRGGVVVSHLRFGSKVLSPQIAPGEADLLVGFEAAETLRWVHMLRPGAPVLTNTSRLTPPVVECGVFDYPDDPVGQLRTLGVPLQAFDAAEIAMEFGDIRLGNTVMLGAMSDHLPFPAAVLRDAVAARSAHKKPGLLEMNMRAFDAGRERAAALAGQGCVAA
ncbi:indolepyruvate oxidoreductase subunit beta [Zoogloea ramigera]|uniref:indolepyruvate oxidoreductase subunit beta n=1 Tax=Zoogloea ramigera TaxID=350 RepID=UPI003FA1CD62